SPDGLNSNYVLIDAADGTELARFLGETPFDDLVWNADGSALLYKNPLGPGVEVTDARGANGIVIDSRAYEAMWLADGIHVAVVREKDAAIVRADGSGTALHIPESGTLLR
ncbi:MAG TPA: hypothetical protein VMS65_09160, partial [Polyangiaceae bacterium]|nr:hypothetical protein [Polyangiaceae bacterium]